MDELSPAIVAKAFFYISDTDVRITFDVSSLDFRITLAELEKGMQALQTAKSQRGEVGRVFQLEEGM